MFDLSSIIRNFFGSVMGSNRNVHRDHSSNNPISLFSNQFDISSGFENDLSFFNFSGMTDDSSSFTDMLFNILFGNFNGHYSNNSNMTHHNHYSNPFGHHRKKSYANNDFWNNAYNKTTEFFNQAGKSISNFGNNIAQMGARVVNSMNSDGHHCYRGVKNALKPLGVNLTGGSAYMAADQLAKNSKFKEVRVSRDQLSKLPAGAVVVWNKGNGHEHGHISIASGDGREFSDKTRRQITKYSTSHRVFLPVDNKQVSSSNIA